MREKAFHAEAEEFGGEILEPYQIMPVQAYGRPGLPCSQSVRALMVAILEDAMRVYLGTGAATRWRRERLEAERWFASTDKSYIFAFERICEVLNFDCDELRNRLRRQRSQRYLAGGAGVTERAA